MLNTVRLHDLCTGNCGCSPRPNAVASGNVFTNSRGNHRLGDLWNSHCAHDGILATGSPNVFTNSRAQGRLNDLISCNSTCAVGSPDVFTN